MFIRTERLFLRPGWVEDSLELANAISDRAVVRNLASVPWPYSQSDAQAYLASVPGAFTPRFLITLPEADGAPIIGAAGLSERGDAVELGYWIARPYWGRGLASEAARAVVALASTLGHALVVASHYIDNPASGRVLEKAGFRRTGAIVERYSVGRRSAYPAREYELNIAGSCGAPDDDGDKADAMGCKRAA